MWTRTQYEKMLVERKATLVERQLQKRKKMAAGKDVRKEWKKQRVAALSAN
jgi:hypothetical protein